MSGPRDASMLPVERPFRLIVNEREIVTLMATPQDLEDLAFGWLWANDLITEAGEVKQLMADAPRALIWVEISGKLPDTFTRTISSGCGGGALIADLSAQLPKLTSTLAVEVTTLARLMDDFFALSVLYKEPGGVHGAAVASPEEVLFVAEDIGRHNAVDKVIGRALRAGEPLEEKLILTTGRISTEMMMKSAKAGFPIVASRTAATDLAVELAVEAGITVAGYTRKGGAVVYTHPERLI